MSAQPATIEAVRREPDVFRRSDGVWTIALHGTVLYFRHYRGLALIAQLLRHPGCALHVLELTSAVPGPEHVIGPSPGARRDDPESFDRERLRACEQQRAALIEEREEAAHNNDIGRAALVTAEIERLAGEVREAMALIDQPSGAGSPAERARVTVQKAIGLALRRIALRDTAVGRYFATTVRTGTWCSFTPDPRFPVAWIL